MVTAFLWRAPPSLARNPQASPPFPSGKGAKNRVCSANSKTRQDWPGRVRPCHLEPARQKRTPFSLEAQWPHGLPWTVVSSSEESAEQFEAGSSAYTVAIPQFEGPLDLLLHLCQKHELDVLDIPIGFITEKYLEYLAVMQLLNLDVASEYLLMAATLAHIKSKMLLPAPPPGQEDDLGEEEEDPRAALIRRLLEYQKYKQAAAELGARGVTGRDVFLRGSPIEEAVHTGLPPLAEVPLFSLVAAFQAVLDRNRVKISHDVVADRISLADRIHQVAD